MKNFFLRVARKAAYGVGKLLELPYDIVKTTVSVADTQPEQLGSTYTGRGSTSKNNSIIGSAIKGLFNLVLTPVQWIGGVLYNATGLRFVTNSIRESADRQVFQEVVSQQNDETKNVKNKLLTFLQQQRRKNNSGRGAFKYREGPSGSNDYVDLHRTTESEYERNLKLYGDHVTGAGWTPYLRRRTVDECIDTLLKSPSATKNDTYEEIPQKNLINFLDARLKRTEKKLKELPRKNVQSNKTPDLHTATYRQHPTYIFFNKKTEKPEERKARLEENEMALKEMLQAAKSL